MPPHILPLIVGGLVALVLGAYLLPVLLLALAVRLAAEVSSSGVPRSGARRRRDQGAPHLTPPIAPESQDEPGPTARSTRDPPSPRSTTRSSWASSSLTRNGE